MFTGLVVATGVLAGRVERGPGARLRVECRLPAEPLTLGESIAVDGVCLSVATLLEAGFEADATAETLARTTLGEQPVGHRLNLERSLRAGDRLGGHLVSGHVDGVGTLTAVHPLGEALAMTFSLPAGLEAFVAEKGSIAINGASMTVNRSAAGAFDVAVIPITRR